MEFPDLTLWRPDAERIASAPLTALAHRMGQAGYDELHRASVDLSLIHI